MLVLLLSSLAYLESLLELFQRWEVLIVFIRVGTIIPKLTMQVDNILARRAWGLPAPERQPAQEWTSGAECPAAIAAQESSEL
jgi:hypothetical protein